MRPLRARHHAPQHAPASRTLAARPCCRCSRAAIDGVFEEMEQLGMAPTEEVYRAAIYGHGAQGHALRAGQVFQRMLAAGVKPGTATYSALINAYAEGCMAEQVGVFRREGRGRGVARAGGRGWTAGQQAGQGLQPCQVPEERVMYRGWWRCSAGTAR